MGVAFRVQDANNFWSLVQLPAYGGWVLYKTVAGVTTIAESAVAGVQVGDRVSVESKGSKITAYVNGKPLLTATDSALATETGVGLYAAGAGAVASGFSAGNLEGGQTDVVYDRAGRVTSTIGPVRVDGEYATSSVVYDAAGNRVEWSDGNGEVTTATFDAMGRMLSRTDPAGGATTWGYDSLGRVVSTQAPGKPAGTVSYVTGDWSASSPAGSKVIATRPDGVSATTTFNIDGRPSGTVYSDATPDVSYTWDKLGRLTKSVGGVTTSRVFDSLGQVTSVTRAGRKVSYSYSVPGRISSVTYPNNKSVARSYDAAGRWVGVTDWDGATTSFDWNLNGQVTGVSPPNGFDTDREFDPVGNVSKVTYSLGGGGWPVSYGRSPAGQVDSVVQWGSSQSWGYDLDAQVTSASAPSGVFGYDPAANPVELAGVSQAFTASGELCWSGTGTGDCSTPPSGATTYTYDQNGQRTSVDTSTGTDAFGYDATGMMTAASPGSSSYTYSVDGLRTSKTTGGVTTTFAWDDTTGVAQLLQDGNDYYIYGPDGLPVERLGASPKRWLVTDGFGSVTLSTDGAGQIAAGQAYDTWGNITGTIGTEAPASLGWQSQYRDAETGLYYLRHRYYDPTTAQFTTPDPLFTITGDRYGYAENDPINQSDPSGLICLGDLCTEDVGHALSSIGAAAVDLAGEVVETGGDLAVDAAEWGWEHRGTIATGVGIGACIAFSAGVCAAATVVAYGVRAQQRVDGHGWDGSWKANLVDLAITGATLGAGSAVSRAGASTFRGMPAWSRRLYNANLAFGDLAGYIGGDLITGRDLAYELTGGPPC